jgi:hypothetical protein
LLAIPFSSVIPWADGDAAIAELDKLLVCIWDRSSNRYAIGSVGTDSVDSRSAGYSYEI